MKHLLKICWLPVYFVLSPISSGAPTEEKAVNEDSKVVTLPAIGPKSKPPKGVSKRLMSDDVSFGYSEKNPILVGSDEEYGGPKAERAYFDLLLDSKGEKVSYKRIASAGAGPDGNPLDIYEVTVSDGTKVRLWVSMYHPKNKPEKQKAPVGFYKLRGEQDAAVNSQR